MNFNRITKQLILQFSFLIFLTFSLSAQTREQVKLIDAQTGQPMTNVSFQYGKQGGISDTNGQISFTYSEADIMHFSHISYGRWQLSDAEVREMIREKSITRSRASIELFPVTVISVKPDAQYSETIDLEYYDKMTHDATTVLLQNPALNAIRKGGNYGFDPVFRGFKYDQLNIMLNGAQQSTVACPSRMDPPTSQMATNITERIEIYKGPYALRYGQGFGGTINFVSPQSEFSETKSLTGRVSAGYEDNGNGLRSEAHLGYALPKTNISLFGAWAEGDDYKTGKGITIPAGFKRYSAGSNIAVKPSANQKLNLMAQFNVARDADYPTLGMDLRKDDTWLINASHEVSFSRNSLKSLHTALFGSFVDHYMDNLLKPLDPRTMNAGTGINTHNYGGRLEGKWLFGSNTLYTGFDLRTEGADGFRTRSVLLGPMAGKEFSDNVWQDAQISKGAVFGEMQIPIKSMQVIISGRLEINSAKSNNPAQEFLDVNAETEQTDVNPALSAGLVKQLSPVSKLSFWAGRSQRSSAISERFINYFAVGLDPYELVGNPSIKPEKINQADVIFEWNNGKSLLNINAFAAYMQDFITSVINPELKPKMATSPGVREFKNFDKALKTGFELSWMQRFSKNFQHHLAMAYTYAEDLERDQPLPEIPPFDFRYALLGTYFGGKLQSELAFRHVLKQDRISEEFGETKTPSFSLLDAKVAWQIMQHLNMNAGVRNIFDTQYYEHLSRNTPTMKHPLYSPGRNFFVSVNYSFKTGL